MAVTDEDVTQDTKVDINDYEFSNHVYSLHDPPGIDIDACHANLSQCSREQLQQMMRKCEDIMIENQDGPPLRNI